MNTQHADQLAYQIKAELLSLSHEKTHLKKIYDRATSMAVASSLMESIRAVEAKVAFINHLTRGVEL